MISRKNIIVLFVALLAWYWQKYIFRGPVYSKAKDFTGKTVFITGGNAGLGKAAATEFAKWGAKVIIASRNTHKAEEVKKQIVEDTKNDKIFVYKLDLEDFDSVRKCVKTLETADENIDILVNNAGAIGVRGRTAEGVNRIHAINYLGHFLLTNMLLDKLKQQSKKRPVRIINVTSHGYKWRKELDFDKFTEDSESIRDDYRFYVNAKFATILFNSELHRNLQDLNITTYAVDPGMIHSEIGSDFPLKQQIIRLPSLLLKRPAYYGAQTILYCAMDDDVVQHSGDYFSGCSREELTVYAKNQTAAKKLWKKSVKLTNLLTT